MNGGSSITFPVADSSGALVWASELARARDRRGDLTCIGCGGRLVLRAGERNAAHFAHVGSEGCSNPESALHQAAKRVIASSIAHRQNDGEPYSATWTCLNCGAARRSNLASPRVKSVEVEVRLDRVRPDIVLRDADGQPRVAIEVVVTHAPEPEAIAWYAANDVSVLEVVPTWDRLNDLRQGFDAPTAHFMRCDGYRHSTPAGGPCACGQHVTSLRLETVAGPECWKCKRVVAVIDVIDTMGAETANRASNPRFGGIEEVAMSMGVSLKKSFSKTEDRTYLMHHCQCGAKAGDYFCYEQTQHNKLIPGATVRHVEVCAHDHWTTIRDTTIPSPAPRRIQGPSTSTRRSDDGWTGVAVESGPTAAKAIRRMFGEY